MFLRIITITLSLFILSSPIKAQVRILTIGDSTMAEYDEEKNSGEKEKRGWAQMLPVFLNDDVRLDNAAKNGRSSKSFYYEYWSNLKESLKPGDYVFIQFGHNDEKGDGLDTSEEDHAQRGTAAWGQYQKYLAKYINESREKGAIPILFTPVVRRLFDKNKQINANGLHNLSSISGNDSTMNYPKAMISLARDLSVPLIDMTALTKSLVEEYGAEKSKQVIYAQKDNTHLKAMGGILFSELAIKELQRQNILSDYISTSSGITIKPDNYNFGIQFAGKSSVKSFHLVSLDLKPDSGEISLSVETPFEIGTSANDTFKKHLSIPYGSGILNSQVFVKFTPEKVEEYKKDITIEAKNIKPRKIMVEGTGFSSKGSSTVNASWTPFLNEDITVNGKITANLKTEGLKFVTLLNERFLTIEGDAWPSGDIDLNASRYIEFSVTADNGELYIDSVMFDIAALGGKEMNFTALGATEPTFAKPESFVVMESLANGKIQHYSFNTIVKVNKGETFHLRLYPWYKNPADGKYLRLDKIFIEGLILK